MDFGVTGGRDLGGSGGGGERRMTLRTGLGDLEGDRMGWTVPGCGDMAAGWQLREGEGASRAAGLPMPSYPMVFLL